MKKCVIYLALLLFVFASCEKIEPEKTRRSLLIYIAANNSLSSYMQQSVDLIAKGYVPDENNRDEVLLVFTHSYNGEPTLYHYYSDRKEGVQREVLETFEDTFNSADIESFRRVRSIAEEYFPSAKHDLVLWSHASGWLPVGYYSSPEPYISVSQTNMGEYEEFEHIAVNQSFGADHNVEMDIIELAASLPDNYYNLVIFDCCLMGCVEVAYQFRNKCRYMIFSPTEILSSGFPYNTIIEKCFKQPDIQGYGGICLDYFNMYDTQTGVNRSATVSLVDCSLLEGLATLCKSIFDNNREAMASVNRGMIQKYYRYNKDFFFDMEDYISAFADAESLSKLHDALDKAVPVKYATDNFIGMPINKYSGLSIYIPKSSYPKLNAYYRNLDWNKATGLIL